MHARVEELIESFENNGWRSEGPVDMRQDWRFEEIIMLQSVWSPVGKKIYLTLLTDPIDIKKKIVWCVSISVSLPEQESLNWIKQITLKDIKRTDLGGFVKQINKIVLEEK